jgi:hypothetical protein
MQTYLSALLGVLIAFICSPCSSAATVDLKKSAPGMVQNLVDCIHSRAPSFDCTGVSVKPEVTCKSAVLDTKSLLTTVDLNVRYRLQVKGKIRCDETAVASFKYDLLAKHPSAGKVTFTTKLGSFEVPMIAVEVVLAHDLVNALALIRSSGQVKRELWSEYDEQKKNYIEKYGPENVYFASSDFVRWATPETAGRWIIELVGSGGTTCEAIAKEAQDQAHKESERITAWLEKKGQPSPVEIADKLMRCQPVSIPNAAIKVAWQPVRYKSTLAFGRKKIGGPIEVTHAAFVLIWLDSSNTTPPKTFSPSATLKPEAPDRSE